MKAPLTVSFTRSNRPANYFPMSDGFRPGAEQDSVQVRPSGLSEAVHAAGLLGEDAMVELATEVAEAVFEATNAPGPHFTGRWTEKILAGLVHEGARGGVVRSLSVGDTVTVGLITLACERSGWSVVVA